MPPEKHLDMPTQSLRQWSSAGERKPVLQHPRLGTWLARLFVFGGGQLLTDHGTYAMYQVVTVSRTWSLVVVVV
jgi:membrane glycosyltransferase